MSLTTTNDTTSPGPEPLTSLDVAKDTAAINDNINSWKIKPAISFPENYNTVKANTNTPENDDNKSPFLQLVPNVDPDTKIYANTPIYYQPKDINPRYKNFILGADNEAISANKQTGSNELGNSIANFEEKAGAYITQN